LIILSVLAPNTSASETTNKESEVVVLYDESYQTKRYKCWSIEGFPVKSGSWDGITDNTDIEYDVKNAAVVRRGRTMYVTDEARDSNGNLTMDANTQIMVWAPSKPGAPRETVWWYNTWDTTRHARTIVIPHDAPVGDYQIQVGDNRSNYVTVYVIFDPSWAKGPSPLLSDAEYESWAYKDEFWKSINDQHDYLNYVYLPSNNESTITVYRGFLNSEAGANGGIFGQRMVEMAMSIHGPDTKTPLEAAIHAYQVVGQRIPWNGSINTYESEGQTEYVNTFDMVYSGELYTKNELSQVVPDTVLPLDIITAEKAALGLGRRDRLPDSYVFRNGQCTNHGSNLAALIRAMGIPARATYTKYGSGWNPFHAWAEAALESPVAKPENTNWWNGIWWKLDSTDPYLGSEATPSPGATPTPTPSLTTSPTPLTAHMEGNIAPIVIDGWGDYLLNEYKRGLGISYNGSYEANTGMYKTVMLRSVTTPVPAEPTPNPTTKLRSNWAFLEGSAWQAVNLFVPWNGSQSSPPDYILDSKYGYVLNSSQSGIDGGIGYINNDMDQSVNTDQDDVPSLLEANDQPGVIGGWGFMIYRIPVNGSEKITVKLVDGANEVHFYGTKDRSIYSNGGRWDLNYDFASTNGQATVYTDGIQQLYIFIQLKDRPSDGNEVSWYTIRTYKHGDLDSDGFVTSTDLALLQRHLLNMTVDINEEAADYNSDGTINTTDFDLLKNHLL
ncbi:MAG: dockerin type I domain-containing protein, partial [Bacillota bacterium]